MSKKRITDDRKQLLIRYKIDEKGYLEGIARKKAVTSGLK